MYYPNDCPVGGYGYLILLYFCVERQGQMRVKFERRQSFEEEFPERIIETIGQVSRWSENPLDKSYLLRVTPYNTICLCFLGLPPTSFKCVIITVCQGFRFLPRAKRQGRN